MSTLVLQACGSLSSDLDKTPPTLPQAYQQQAKATPSPVLAQVEPEWWRAYNSPALNSLMQEALKDVAVLRQAQARILQAQAQARIAGASLLPELQGNLSAQRDAPFSSSHGDSRSQYVAGAFMSYELDLWGRNRAQADSAVFLAQAANYELDVLLPHINALLQQVRRNVQLFCSSSGHRELSKLVLTGGGSLLPGLVAQVGNELNCEVLHPDPFALFGKPKGEGGLAHGAKYMTALGLALRSFTPCQI